jgi:hypothetical protein
VTDASEPTHEGHVVIGDIRTLDAPEGVGLLTLRFVHYPGSQQLTLWLPQSGYQGYGELSVTRGEIMVERGPVRSRLNGSVQILFDTLSWPPGDYSIVITHDEGWRHEAALRKLEPGVAPPAPEPVPPVEDAPRGPIVYRDGFGKVIPDVDLEMRAGLRRDLASKFGRRLEYEGNFRAGTIVYIDGDVRIEFYHEMCGGRLKFSIDVPAVDHWEAATGTPLSAREEIVAFVAQRVKQEQASSWNYEITARSIDFY